MEAKEAFALEAALRRTFLRRTYTFAGFSIGLSGVIAAAIYRFLGEKGPLFLMEKLERLSPDWRALAILGGLIGILIIMLLLGLLLMSWIEKMHIPLFVIFIGWIGFAAIGGLLLSPVFYIAGPTLTLKVFVATGIVFTLTGLLASVIGIDLTQWGGQIMSVLIMLLLMAVVNLFLRSEMLDWVWMYGGLLIWIVVAVYSHQLLQKLPMPTLEEAEKGGLTRLAIAGALLLYVIFYALFVRLLMIALSQQEKRRRR